MEKNLSAQQTVLIWLIKAYRVAISPWFGAKCRFHPTCSQYAIDAISEHGMIKGCWLSGKRILKCHPFSEGGFDPVPSANKQIKQNKEK